MSDISRQLKLQRERKLKGYCYRCGKNTPAAGKKSCEVCLKGIINNIKNIKDIVFNHYGGYKCACCGEITKEFLTIDHIDNNGGEHRKKFFPNSSGSGHTLYRWIMKNNFPPIFQILCFNCNCGKSLNGGICPHKSIVK